ncbi:PstS family phosphate ABC transporter substrate-binding protein [Paraburkholderia youngii]|uniref:PstS family phosphate ABC transporter substrate-binding protein n=1 Tax=Paraburkholderia youngii TaxID=2782701 RepID=UPI003D25B3DE
MNRNFVGATLGVALLMSITTSATVLAETGTAVKGQGAGESTEGLDMQAARARMMTARGRHVAYTRQFDLSGLPDYTPKQKIHGTIRVWGSNYITDGFLGGYWEAAFKKYQPDATIDWHMNTTLSAVPSLALGVSDVGIGRKITFQEQELFERSTNHAPVEIDIATGSYDVPGWQPGYGVVVNKDNPLTRISMEQLDEIFGAERTGGWEGTSWRPNWARGPEKNIRSWGQLGLGGEWANKPINVYGLTLRYHQATEISDRILKGSDKWNEHLTIYANYVSKSGKLERGMNEDLAKDPYGIGIVAAPTTNLTGGASEPTQKILPVAWKDGGPYVPYSLETLQNRTYPLYDQIFAYLDHEAGKPVNPGVVEFLRFVLSRQGQELVQKDGKYLPLTAEVAKAGLQKLDALEK